jgi:hypothetical protein
MIRIGETDAGARGYSHWIAEIVRQIPAGWFPKAQSLKDDLSSISTLKDASIHLDLWLLNFRDQKLLIVYKTVIKQTKPVRIMHHQYFENIVINCLKKLPIIQAGRDVHLPHRVWIYGCILRASLRVCQILLGKSCVLPTTKRICQVKKSSSPTVWHNSLAKLRSNLHQESWEK